MRFYTFYNGKCYGQGDAFISLSDRCVFFGDGIYDACISRGGRIFMPDEHVDRFIGNAKRTGIPLPYSRGELCDILSDAAAKSKKTSFIYFQLTRFCEERRHSGNDGTRSNFLLTASDTSLPDPAKTLTLIGCEDTRHLMCDVKTLNLMIACAAAREAERRGADEAVFIRDGTVTECAHSNLHIIKDGVIYTHPRDRMILPGISRAHMLLAAEELGIPCIEKEFSEGALMDADEVLVTSTSKICLRARRYENVEYDTKAHQTGLAICRKMRNDFDFYTK